MSLTRQVPYGLSYVESKRKENEIIEQTGCCQRVGREVRGEMGERSQKVQISSYK